MYVCVVYECTCVLCMNVRVCMSGITSGTFHQQIFIHVFMIVCVVNFSLQSVPQTVMYFTAYDQLKVKFGYVPGEKNIIPPLTAGVCARGM